MHENISSDYLGMVVSFPSLSYSILHEFVKWQCIIFTDRNVTKRTCLYTYKNMAFQSLETTALPPQLPCYQLLEWNLIDLEVAISTSPGEQNPPWWGVGRPSPREAFCGDAKKKVSLPNHLRAEQGNYP